MAAFLLPLLAGALEGFAEKTKREDLINAADIQEKLKSSYTSRLEKKKELDTERAAATKVVNSLRGIEFADGPLDNSQLINIATKPKLAESILKKLDDDPEWFKKTNRGFIKAVEGVDPTIDINKHFEDVYRLQKEAAVDVAALFAAPQDASFLEKRTARKNLMVAKQTAAKLGVSLEDLMSSYKPSSSFVSNMGRVDPSALTKPEDFEKIKSRLMAEHTSAGISKDPVAIKKADDNLGALNLTEQKVRFTKMTQEDIKSDLALKIIEAKKSNTPEGQNKARNLEVELQQYKALTANLPTPEKVTQANWVSIANSAVRSRMDFLIPGKFISVLNKDESISMSPKGIADKEFQAALTKAKNEIINDFTVKGVPKSDFHKNALMSIGVSFVGGKSVIGGMLTTDDVAAAASAAPAPVPAPTAPVVPASTASGRSTPTSALPLPYTPEGQPDTSKLIAGKTYRSSTGGTRKWNGTNWEQQ